MKRLLIKPPEVCEPHVSFLCNRKGALIVQEKCSDSGVCHDWTGQKSGLLTYACQKESQFESNCYARLAKSAQLAWLREQEAEQADDTDCPAVTRDPDSSNNLDGDGIPIELDPDDDNDGIPDDQDVGCVTCRL